MNKEKLKNRINKIRKTAIGMATAVTGLTGAMPASAQSSNLRNTDAPNLTQHIEMTSQFVQEPDALSREELIRQIKDIHTREELSMILPVLDGDQLSILLPQGNAVDLPLNLNFLTEAYKQELEEKKQEGFKVTYEEEEDPEVKASYRPSLNTINFNPLYNEAGVRTDEQTTISQEEFDRRAATFHPSTISHEKSHRAMDLDGAYAPGLNDIYLAKINMNDERRANLVDCSLALNYYRNTENDSGFEFLVGNCGKECVSALKGYLKEHPDAVKEKSPECVEFMVKTVCQSWLAKNNIEGQAYSDEAFSIGIGAYGYADISKENQQAEYLARSKKMFSNVPGLGDVSQWVDLDFELNSQLKDDLTEVMEAKQSFRLTEEPAQILSNVQDETMRSIFKGIAQGETDPEIQYQKICDVFYQLEKDGHKPYTSNPHDREAFNKEFQQRKQNKITTLYQYYLKGRAR